MTDDPTRPDKKRGAYPKRWRNGLPILLPGIWPDTMVHTHEAARILGVDVRTIERLRTLGMGPVQIPSGTFWGRVVRYLVWELLVRRNKIIGAGPIDREGIWAWLMETKADPAGPRPEPPPKPPGTPKGEQRRETNRRLRSNFILRLVQAEDQHAQRLFQKVGSLPTAPPPATP